MTTTKIIATSLVSLALLTGCDDADKSATSSSSAVPATTSTVPEKDAAIETTEKETTEVATTPATEAPADATKPATETSADVENAVTAVEENTTKAKEASVEAIEKVTE